MRSKRFYVVVLLAFATLINLHGAFDLFHIFQERGTDEENLKGTKYFYNDCGKVIMVDRTESYPTSTAQGNARIDYYVTYYSKAQKEATTLKVTPSAYLDAKKYLNNGTEICFLCRDSQYVSHFNTKAVYTIFLALTSIFLLIQSFMWLDEEFFMDEKKLKRKQDNYYI